MKRYEGVIIDMAHADAVQSVLDTAQTRARTRTITAKQVIAKCEEVSRRLDISRKALEGTAFVADINAEAFPHAYKGVPESTHFEAVFINNGWRMTRVYRAAVAAPTLGTRICLTDTAKRAVLLRIATF